MAELTTIPYKFSYRELSDAKDLWEELLKSQMSSIYNGDYTSSALHSSLTRAMAGILGSLDLMFDASTEAVSVQDIPQELLYTHFGFLLKDKRGRSSLEEYRELLINLLDVVFKGLTIEEATEGLSSRFNAPTVSVSLMKPQRNTTLRSIGLNHVNTPLNLSVGRGMTLNSYNDNSNFYSSKESNVINLTSTLDEDYSFNERKFLLIFAILKLVGSAITPIRLNFMVSSHSMVGRSTSVSLEQKHSTTNFMGVDKHLVHFPTPELKFSPEYLNIEDRFDYSGVASVLEKAVGEYTYNVEDIYNVTRIEAGNLPRVFETIEKKEITYNYGDFTYDMNVPYGVNESVEDAGCPITREDNPPFGEPFGELVFGEDRHGYQPFGTLVQPSRNLIGRSLEIGNFVLGFD